MLQVRRVLDSFAADRTVCPSLCRHNLLQHTNQYSLFRRICDALVFLSLHFGPEFERLQIESDLSFVALYCIHAFFDPLRAAAAA